MGELDRKQVEERSILRILQNRTAPGGILILSKAIRIGGLVGVVVTGIACRWGQIEPTTVMASPAVVTFAHLGGFTIPCLGGWDTYTVQTAVLVGLTGFNGAARGSQKAEQA